MARAVRSAAWKTVRRTHHEECSRECALWSTQRATCQAQCATRCTPFAIWSMAYAARSAGAKGATHTVQQGARSTSHGVRKLQQSPGARRRPSAPSAPGAQAVRRTKPCRCPAGAPLAPQARQAPPARQAPQALARQFPLPGAPVPHPAPLNFPPAVSVAPGGSFRGRGSRRREDAQRRPGRRAERNLDPYSGT